MGGDPNDFAARDGALDFSGYSLSQLLDLRGLLDRAAFPRNYANLLAEIERREAAAAPATSPEALPPGPQPLASGRFTQHDGWRGWLEALRRRAPAFGAGMIEIGPDEVKLLGNRRTWLGVTEPGEYSAPLDFIRNVALDGSELRFEIKRRFWPARIVTFDAGSAAQAQALRQQLPVRQSAGFERRWREAREFHDQLNALGGHRWVTPALVLVNLLVFVATLIGSKAFQPDAQLVFEWGANYGPMTTSGQWWRILSSMFLHGSWEHVLLNMYVLWNIGRLTERLYGSASYAFLYFATGICGAFMRTVWDPSIASIGASGAVFGILGALLAMLLHRGSRIPRSIALAHWPSTLLFVVFNLVGGAMNPLIDNAAHVGGLLSGVLLGWALVRPVDASARREFPVRQVVSAAVVSLLLGVAFFAHLRTASGQATAHERYMLDRPWYSRGEAENLKLWVELLMRSSAGNISAEEMADTFEKRVIPFWKTTDERLQKEESAVPASQQALDGMVRKYVKARLGWAEGVRNLARDQTRENAVALQERVTDTYKAMAELQRFDLRSAADQRPRALANHPLVIRMRNLLSADEGKCVYPPAYTGELPAFSDSPSDGPKMRMKAGCRAQQLFVTRDYQALEDFITHSATTLGDLRDGSSTLTGILGGLDDYFEYSGVELERLFGYTSEWRRTVKNPVGAEITEILLLRNWAWSARGEGYAKTVSPQQWETFGLRLEMAAAGLREVRTRAAGNPLWYSLALQVGGDQDAGAGKLDELFGEGVKRFPDYLPLYKARLRSFMPRWGGTLGQVDVFIQTVADEHRGALEPDEWYAMLYSQYAAMERDETNVFVDGNADWGRVAEGFDKLRRRYPRSDAIVNNYARLACSAKDEAKYLALRPLIGARPSSTCWTVKLTIEACDEKFRRTAAQP